jgi:hypothetical protein
MSYCLKVTPDERLQNHLLHPDQASRGESYLPPQLFSLLTSTGARDL